MKSEKEIRETIAKFEEIKNEAYDKGKFLVASSITTIIETLKWVLEVLKKLLKRTWGKGGKKINLEWCKE